MSDKRPTFYVKAKETRGEYITAEKIYPVYEVTKNGEMFRIRDNIGRSAEFFTRRFEVINIAPSEFYEEL